MLYGLLASFVGIFVLVSPIIAVIAMIQWLSVLSKRHNGAGYSDYQKGYVDGFQESLRRTQLQLTEQGTVDQSYIETQMGFYSGYTPPVVVQSAQVATPATTREQWGATGVSLASSSEMLEVTQPQYGIVTEAAAPAPPVVALTSAEKSKRMLNVLLSLSSLLFIAAGIAFIASGLSDGVKLIGIIGVVALFYGGGMLLHAYSKMLKPAAVAFIGTGLGLIPFLGVALAAYTPLSDENAWLVVSVLGTIAYIVAALYLRSQVVSYLAMAFILSLTSAAVATAALPFVWYFAALIGVSLTSSVVAHLKLSWMPAIFTAPVARTGDLVTPLALVASIFAVRQLELYEYQILFWLATAQYFVAWLQTKQQYFEHIVRALLHIALLLAIKEYSGDNWPLFGLGFIVVSVAQQLYSLVRQLYLQHAWRSYELAWIGVMLAFQLLSVSFWGNESNFHALSALSYSVICAMSALTVYITRVTGFGYVTTIASLLLPAYVGFFAMNPVAQTSEVTLVYFLLATVSLGVYYWLRNRRRALRAVLVTATVSHLVVGTICIGGVENSLTGLLFALLGAVLITVMSHLYRQPYLVVATALYMALIALRMSDLMGLESGEWYLAMFTFAALLSYASMAAYAVLKDRKRRNALLAIGHSFVALFGLVCLGNFGTLSLQTAKSIGAAVLLVWIVTSVVLKRLTTADAPVLRMLYAGFAFVYYAIALMLAVMLPDAWEIATLVLGILLLWEFSYAERSVFALFVANALTIWFVFDILQLMGAQSPWLGFSAVVIAATLFYGGYWWFVIQKDEQRRLAMIGSTWIMTMVGFLGWAPQAEITAAAALLLICGAVTVSVEGYMRKDKNLLESGVYVATFGLSVLTNTLWPELNLVFTAHLWAASFAGLAVWRGDSTVRYVLAATCLTLIVGLYALIQGGGYSLLFLFEHILLLIVGFMSGRLWALRWGLIASILAIFYYLRDIPFVGFALLGALLVAFVIWRLNKSKKLE